MSRKTRSILIRVALVFLVCGIIVVGGMLGSILIAMNKVIDIAQKNHYFPNDNISALIAFVESDKHSLNDRNQAVWTLGQLGNSRAVPVLEKYYTGYPCNHQTTICQYEVVKALKKCGSTMNINTKEYYRRDK